MKNFETNVICWEIESLSLWPVLSLIKSPLFINAPLQREFYVGRAQRKRPGHKKVYNFFFIRELFSQKKKQADRIRIKRKAIVVREF